MFKPTAAKTPEEYIQLQPEPRRAEIQELFDFICKSIPSHKPFIMSGFIGWGEYHYKYASGREGDWMAIALASQKNYISVYICPTDSEGYLPDRFKDKLGKVSIGKSCIRFKKISDINLPALKELVLMGIKLIKK